MKRKTKLLIVEALASAFDNIHFAHLEMEKEGIATDEIPKARDLVGAEVARLKNIFFHGGKA